MTKSALHHPLSYVAPSTRTMKTRTRTRTKEGVCYRMPPLGPPTGRSARRTLSALTAPLPSVSTVPAPHAVNALRSTSPRRLEAQTAQSVKPCSRKPNSRSVTPREGMWTTASWPMNGTPRPCANWAPLRSPPMSPPTPLSASSLWRCGADMPSTATKTRHALALCKVQSDEAMSVCPRPTLLKTKTAMRTVTVFTTQEGIPAPTTRQADGRIITDRTIWRSTLSAATLRSHNPLPLPLPSPLPPRLPKMQRAERT
mmetsp:Transcript_21769/g.30280  ORF Transcript_21769/g.30280 Transcript_21769/m.30280 type:complete len:256 (-) Transcript_21769:930-1697(-)